MPDVFSYAPGVEDQRLDRLVVRVAMWGSWLATAALVLAAVLSGRSGMVVEAIGPATVAVLATVQVVLGRERAWTTSAVAVVVVVVTADAADNPSTEIAAALAIVALATVGVVFVRRHAWWYVAGGGAVMAAVPVIWDRTAAEALPESTVMAIAFVVGASSFHVVRAGAVAVDSRYRRHFDRAPVGMMEQDWSVALRRVEELGAGSDGELFRRLRDDPDALARVMDGIRTTRVNAAMAEIAGAPEAALLAGRIPPGGFGLPAPVWAELIVGVRRDEHLDRRELPVTRLDGSRRWVEVRSFPAAEDRCAQLIVVVDDITEQRRAADALADLVRSKDEFIAGVSHELRTPLTAVVGFAAELSRGEDLPAELRTELARTILAQAGEMAFIVQDLLVAARAEIGTLAVEPVPLDLADLARTVVSELAVVHGPGWRVEADGPVPTHADPTRVKQIVRNLMVNAERYGGPRRRVVVEGADGEAWLEVRDDGPPIPAGARDRIFEPYERGEDRPGVTVAVGLGLAVSRRLAGLMNGDLSYRHDGESVFRLALPARDRSETAPVGVASGV